MAEPIWVTMEFKNVGKIESTDSKGRKAGDFDLGKHFEAFFYEHSIDSPRDAATGMASGKRLHHPVKFIKRVDSASPGLWSALTTNDTLKKAEFFFFKSNREGKMENYFKVTLEDGAISNIHLQFNQAEMSDRDTGGGSAGQRRAEASYASPALEEISVTYAKITWSHVIAKKEATDDWRSSA
jgi:type VI secretion system secreted protein Hcp